MVGAVFSRLVALAASIAIARLLTAESFGQFLLIQSTLGTFGIFAGLGLGVVATKFCAELNVRNPERLGRILNLVRMTAVIGSVVVAGALAATSHLIAEEVFNRPHLSTLIAVTAVTVVLLTIDGYNNAALFGLEKIKEAVQGSLAATLLATPITILLTWKLGLHGAVYGTVLLSFLQCAISHLILSEVLRRQDITYRRQALKEWRVLQDYAVPAFLGGVMVVPAHWFCQTLIADNPEGMSQVSVLGVGLQWFQVVLFLPIALGRVVLPVLTDIIAEDSKHKSNIVLKSAIAANAIISVPVAAILALFSQEIMRLYGIYVPYAWAALSLMVIAAAVSATCAPVGQVMIANGKIWHGWLMNTGWAIIYVFMAFLLLDLGALGVAIGLLIAYICHSIWVCVWTWKNLRLAS